ncbi:hypothetical protein DPV78_005855 [Talaromyces pinophilus]|nr:hypothetical protein DPV78_005855 [Talaromyces pinophilus]
MEKVSTVVVQVGFSETYQELLSDARQWLGGRYGANLVVIVDVKEDESALLDVRNSRESRDRLRELVGMITAFRNDEGARDSDELRDEIESKLNVDDWIGPLTVLLEKWELKDQVFQRRGPRFQILPRPHRRMNPTIPIIDMIPKDKRARFRKADKALEMELDLNEARQELRDGIRQLALERALEHIQA